MDSADIAARAADLVAERYLFADIGEQLAALVRRRAADGTYATADPATLAERVTADLQSINRDRHLRLTFHPDPLPDAADEDNAAWLAMFAAQARANAGGVRRVERRAGNVGLLELGPMLYPAAFAGPALVAAMQILHAVDALLLDVRELRGGDPASVALVCSFFFAEPTHLHTMLGRGDARPTQSWTHAYLPAPRLAPDAGVWVLTSGTTFSGGEELAYDLQQLGRVTVVGEPTGGGAHAREGIRLHEHLELTVPVVRPVNPVSGTNWEGTGVRPDVETPAADALERAEALAVAALRLRTDRDPALVRELDE